MMTNQELGKRLKAARQEKNVTQEEMAKACGVSKNHLSVIERGLNTCSSHMLITYAETLHISLDALTGIDENTKGILPELGNALRQLSPQDQKKVLDVIKIIFS